MLTRRQKPSVATFRFSFIALHVMSFLTMWPLYSELYLEIVDYS